MNKIVALWCHPRSMSTSVERIMRERGDFECLHEPFMYHYYLNQKHRAMPYFEPMAGHPVRYEDVRDMILDKAQTSPVFIKDMAYYIDTDIVTDTDFYQSLTHCFLIRSPRAAIGSYYKLDQAVTLPEIGIESQWRIYQHLVGLGIKPVVMQAEDIRKDPESIVGQWWHSIGVENKESAFQWSNETPGDWKQVQAWHQSSIKSTSIKPWTQEDAAREMQSFQVAANEAPHLRSYLAHHQTFYDQLRAQAL